MSHGFAQHQHRLADEFEHMRQALDGTGDQIEAEYIQQGDEPPGVVHVEEAELPVDLQLRGAYRGNILRGEWPLGQDCADNRGKCQ